MLAQARWYGWVAGLDRVTVAWIGVVLLLSAATFFIFTELRRFNVVPTPWPFDPHFEALATGTGPTSAGEPAGWQIEGDPAGVIVEGGTLRLRNADPEGGITVRQVWRLEPDGPRAFRLAATIASQAITGGRPGYRVGEVTLVADDAIHRTPHRAIHQLAAVRGTREPAKFVDFFEFPSSARQVELAIRLHHATGEISVRGFELRALQERWLFRSGRTGLQLAWAVTLAIGCWLFWRGIDDRRSAFVLVAAAGGGLLLLMMPQPLRDATLTPLLALVPARLVGLDLLADLGHFVIFAVAGFLLRLSRRREPWWIQAAFLVALAGLSELLQFLAELRSPSLDDWLTNAAGAFTGWLPAMGWLMLSQDGQLDTQRCSSTTVPPQAAKQRRYAAAQPSSATGEQSGR